jgi:hypothetical protein
MVMTSQNERYTESLTTKRRIIALIAAARPMMADLEGAMGAISLLESQHMDIASILKPIMWHTDLHLGNIYVSEEDPTQIVSIIDWQSISVGPLFLQATWPEFLKLSDDYVWGVVQPQLPNNFDESYIAEKEFAISTRDDALITKSVLPNLTNYAPLSITTMTSIALLTYRLSSARYLYVVEKPQRKVQ